ncbi:MAG: NAD(P)H-binding protein [Chitinophagales bacterium]
MKNKKTALIAGATGLVGNALLQLLLDDDRYSEVRVLSRSSLEIEHPKLKEELLQFGHLQDFAAHFEVDHVFCCLGTTIKKAGSEAAFKKVDQEYPLVMAQLAHEKKVAHFLIITAMGANSGSLIFYNKVKGQVESAIKDLKLKATSVLRPSLLLGDRKESRIGEQVGTAFMKLAAPFMLGSLKKYKAIEAKTVAKAMLRIANSEKEGFNIYESDALQKLGSK